MSIQENIAAIRRRMAEAARQAGRDPGEILLVGASKMNDAAACREAIAAGIDVLGENRVQEMTAKLQEGAYDGAPLHFIGHLQRNKVRQVVGRVSLIHSVSSLELMEEIHRQAQKMGLVQDVLLEVNVGGEESKSGFAPQAVAAAGREGAGLWPYYAGLLGGDMGINGTVISVDGVFPNQETISDGSYPFAFNCRAVFSPENPSRDAILAFVEGLVQ